MILRIALVAASVMLSWTAPCSAGGDPFYYSTWYAQSSAMPAWMPPSVMHGVGDVSTIYSQGPIAPMSPRYYLPGYGYAVPQRISALRMSAFQPTWSYGVLQPSSVSAGIFGTSGSAGYTVVPGTLHLPWFHPGSPGNFRSPVTVDGF